MVGKITIEQVEQAHFEHALREHVAARLDLNGVIDAALQPFNDYFEALKQQLNRHDPDRLDSAIAICDWACRHFATDDRFMIDKDWYWEGNTAVPVSLASCNRLTEVYRDCRVKLPENIDEEYIRGLYERYDQCGGEPERVTARYAA